MQFFCQTSSVNLTLPTHFFYFLSAACMTLIHSPVFFHVNYCNNFSCLFFLLSEHLKHCFSLSWEQLPMEYIICLLLSCLYQVPWSKHCFLSLFQQCYRWLLCFVTIKYFNTKKFVTVEDRKILGMNTKTLEHGPKWTHYTKLYFSSHGKVSFFTSNQYENNTIWVKKKRKIKKFIKTAFP